MAIFSKSLRALGAGLILAALSASCQAVFGDFKIDDAAFDGGAGAGSGGLGGDGSGSVQQGPIYITPTEGLYTTEAGGQATFTIVLKSKPGSDVSIGLSSSNLNEGKVSPASVVFTKDNWNAPQIVTVTGVDDTLPDGNQTYRIVTAKAESDDAKFNGVDAIDVTLINIDNETAGVTVAPTSGLVTSESGMQDTFTVVLNSKPSRDVTIGLTSSNKDEGTVMPSSLVFTSVNWMAPQLVTVTGVDDSKKDGEQPYSIITAAAASSDHNYNGLEVPDVAVTNEDNETAGITITLVNGISPTDKTKLRTSENGDTATFTVQLNTQPSAEVTIAVSSDAPDEAGVNPASITFTPLDWNAPQTVTVMGVDDKVADGDQPFNVVLGAPHTDDHDYDNLTAINVPATNVDNDHPGFSIALVSGIDPNDASKLMTSESGDTATFTVALNSKPTANVSIGLASTAPSEGTVSPVTLVFSKDNWNAPQTVTVKGVDDAIADGSPVYYVRTSAATSDDKGYAGVDPPDVQATNRDNDTANVVVALTGGIDPANGKQLVTSEAGDSATFTIALTSQPTDDVTITVGSSNVKEGTVSPTTLKFTAANYAAPQSITVTGVDDKVADGNQAFVIAIGATSSKDQSYNGKFGTQVTATNRDNDSAGIIVSPITGLTTSEGGRTATFTVQLQSQPTQDVTIGLSSNNTAEGTVNVSTLNFTALNWNAPQTVTVTGVQDDGTADGPQVYKIVTAAAVSKDTKYAGINPQDVTLTNSDDDTAGIVVMPTTGLSTTEAGGTATFTVNLQSKPAGAGATVNIVFSSSKPSEGKISPTTLKFTGDNYNAKQTITVTGVDDAVQDGPQVYKITAAGASSIDPNYFNMIAPEVTVTNLDNDSADIQISPTPTATPAKTSEKGDASTFTLQLNSQPTAPVSFSVSSTNAAEGTVSPASLAFTASNWNVPQTVTVTGVDDKIADGDQPYKVRISAAVSSDKNYSGKFGVDLPFSNTDDDHPGYLVSNITGMQTTEAGGTVTFTVALFSQPTASVTVGISSSNTKEGKVSPASLLFTASNWATPQTVTVTGVDDKVADGPQVYSVNIANAVSADTKYNGQFGVGGFVTNVDDDTPGFKVAPTTGLTTTEAGGKATFTVALATQPTGTNTVTLSLTSSNTKEGTVSPASLVFTTDTWSVAQTVTVTGADDKKVDGPQTYAIQFGPATSGDAGYANKAPPSVSIINKDDDVADVKVSPLTCATTPATTATFTLVLTSQPAANVGIGTMSDNMLAGTSSPGALFTSDNWNVPQTITVTGLADGTVGVATPYNIVTTNASSPGDPVYDGLVVSDVACTNTTP